MLAPVQYERDKKGRKEGWVMVNDRSCKWNTRRAFCQVYLPFESFPKLEIKGQEGMGKSIEEKRTPVFYGKSKQTSIRVRSEVDRKVIKETGSHSPDYTKQLDTTTSS